MTLFGQTPDSNLGISDLQLTEHDARATQAEIIRFNRALRVNAIMYWR